METSTRPFQIKMTDVSEIRMGSPYNHCHIELIGTNKIKLPKSGWQDKYAWTSDSKRLVLVKWNLENNIPSFNFFLIDTEKDRTLESKRMLGIVDSISIIGDKVKYKNFLYNKEKSSSENLFDEEYEFNW